MTSVVNLFSNFDDLTKNKSITDSAAEYKANKSDLNNPSPALTQGEKFKKYQKKIKKNLEKKINAVNSKEGFQSLEQIDKNLQFNPDGLTSQSLNIIRNNNFSSQQQQTIANLQQEYQNTLNEYENLVAQVSGSTTGYLNRVNPNNPYLNKTIRFTTGHICYVTAQGVVKYVPTPAIWDSVNIPKNWTQIDLPYDNSYQTPGTQIPTTPPLISGTNVELGQSFGNEGSNVFVNSVVNNPSSSYVGCYNNTPPATEVIFVPVMNSSNNVNGYMTYSTSNYQGNNQWGAWAAFDRNPNDFWHQEVSGQNDYNSTTGVYTGVNYVGYYASGQPTTSKGEYIQVNLPGVNTSNAVSIPLTKYDIQGRQGCCGANGITGRSPNSWVVLGYNSGSWYLVDQRDNQALNFELRTYYVSNPQPYQAYIFLTTNCGNRYCVQIAQWNLYTSSNYVTNPTQAMTNAGQMNFDQCQEYALLSGNQYFGLQAVNGSGVGNCMISNNLTNSQMYGVGNIFQPVALWASNTASSETSNPGATATLTSTGALSVLNSSSQSVFSSDTSNANPGNYLGCYNDCWQGRGLPTILGSGETYETCQSQAKAGNWSYFGIQYTQPNGTSECWVGNDMQHGMMMGKATNCTTVNGGPVGGSCSNAIYNNTASTSNYFLILQDDGNLCIYRGTSPSDNQGYIWCTMTNGKQQQANPNFTAAKGKYGQNWMPSGSTLAAGDWIGSTNGSMYLIMQSDGNLVLYTNTQASGCSNSNAAGGKTVGQQNINSLYEIANMGNKNNIGQLAYIDQNSELHSYPTNNRQGNNNYSLVSEGIDSWGNDIPGAAYGNATLQSCQSSCNNNPECAGFVMNAANNICWPKTSSFYPNGNFGTNPDRKIYVRGQSPISTPVGVPTAVNNIDSLTYQGYVNGGALGNSYGLANATSTQKQQLDQLQSKMNLLTSQINTLTGQFGTGSNQAAAQMGTNVQGIQNYLQGINTTNNKIQNFDTNVERILSDSDIVVLQKNYNYLFWSILAAGSVLVTMNIVKK